MSIKKNNNKIYNIKVKRIIDYGNPTDEHIDMKKIREIFEKQKLNPEQMRLQKEIREKCYPAYIEFSQDMVDTYQQAMNCIKTNKPEPLQPDIIDQESFRFIWPKFLFKMGEHAKNLVLYIKSLPGFNQIDVDDLAILFDKHS